MFLGVGCAGAQRFLRAAEWEIRGEKRSICVVAICLARRPQAAVASSSSLMSGQAGLAPVSLCFIIKPSQELDNFQEVPCVTGS